MVAQSHGRPRICRTVMFHFHRAIWWGRRDASFFISTDLRSCADGRLAGASGDGSEYSEYALMAIVMSRDEGIGMLLWRKKFTGLRDRRLRRPL